MAVASKAPDLKMPPIKLLLNGYKQRTARWKGVSSISFEGNPI